MHKKILSVLLCALLILHPFSLYADDIASDSASLQSTPTPALTPTDTISPTQEPTPTSSDSDALGDTAAASSSATIDIINTGDTTDVSSTHTASDSATVTTTNDAQVDQTVNTTANTGNNTADKTVLSETNTGDANNTTTIVNEVNTNTIGEDIHKDVVVLNSDHEGDIDLSDKPPCDDRSPAAQAGFKLVNSGDTSNFSQTFIDSLYRALYTINKAKIVNEINLAANTGNNTSAGLMNIINTGDANAVVNVFNLVNTNLIGNCGYFGSITVFGDQTEDIILPNEQNYLGEPIELSENDVIFVNSGDNSTLNSSVTTNNATHISNTNTATIVNDISVSSNTGGNESTGLAGSVQTGAATTSVHTLDRANTNLVGDRWVLVIVNTTGDWNGGVENWNGNTQSNGSSTMMWVRLPQSYGSTQQSGEVVNSGDNTDVNMSSEKNSSLAVETTNEATVENKITVTANTGNNSADGLYNDMKTGDATVTVQETTTANTTIIGNNWFFSLINIFGNFNGNVVFARPDLEITKTADKAEAGEGESIGYTISYTNKGKSSAHNVLLTDLIPSGTEVLSYSTGGNMQNGAIVWNLGTLAKGASGSVNVLLRSNASRPEIVNTASIATSSQEPNKANNGALASTRLRAAAGTTASASGAGQSSSSPSVTPTPTVVYQTTILGVGVTQPAVYQSSSQYKDGYLQKIRDEVSTGSGDILSLGAFDEAGGKSASYCSINSELCIMLGTGFLLPAVVYVGWRRRAFIVSRVRAMNIF